MAERKARWQDCNGSRGARRPASLNPVMLAGLRECEAQPQSKHPYFTHARRRKRTRSTKPRPTSPTTSIRSRRITSGTPHPGISSGSHRNPESRTPHQRRNNHGSASRSAPPRKSSTPEDHIPAQPARPVSPAARPPPLTPPPPGIASAHDQCGSRSLNRSPPLQPPQPSNRELRFPLLESKISLSSHGRLTHPQLRHHRAYRPRQIHFGGPPSGTDRIADRARDAGAGARLHGPGARTRHYHQSPRGSHRCTSLKTARLTT